LQVSNSNNDNSDDNDTYMMAIFQYIWDKLVPECPIVDFSGDKDNEDYILVKQRYSNDVDDSHAYPGAHRP